MPTDNLDILPKGLQPIATPDFILSFGMQNWLEILVENIFMKNNWITRHAYSPQTFQQALNFSNAKRCG